MPETAISGLLIPFESDLAADHLRTFAPHLLEQPHAAFSNAAIILLDDLQTEQISFLTSRGVVQVEAELKMWSFDTFKDGYESNLLWRVQDKIAEVQQDHYICVIQVETLNQGYLHVIKAYIVPRTP